jgi:hypothetical protein
MNDPYNKINTLELIILVLLIIIIIVVIVVIFFLKKRKNNCNSCKEQQRSEGSCLEPYKSFSEFGYNPPHTTTIIPRYIDSTLPIVEPNLCFDRDIANGFPSRHDTRLIYDDETPVDCSESDSDGEDSFEFSGSNSWDESSPVSSSSSRLRGGYLISNSAFDRRGSDGFGFQDYRASCDKKRRLKRQTTCSFSPDEQSEIEEEEYDPGRLFRQRQNFMKTFNIKEIQRRTSTTKGFVKGLKNRHIPFSKYSSRTSAIN